MSWSGLPTLLRSPTTLCSMPLRSRAQCAAQKSCSRVSPEIVTVPWQRRLCRREVRSRTVVLKLFRCRPAAVTFEVQRHSRPLATEQSMLSTFPSSAALCDQLGLRHHEACGLRLPSVGVSLGTPLIAHSTPFPATKKRTQSNTKGQSPRCQDQHRVGYRPPTSHSS